MLIDSPQGAVARLECRCAASASDKSDHWPPIYGKSMSFQSHIQKYSVKLTCTHADSLDNLLDVTTILRSKSIDAKMTSMLWMPTAL